SRSRCPTRCNIRRKTHIRPARPHTPAGRDLFALCVHDLDKYLSTSRVKLSKITRESLWILRMDSGGFFGYNKARTKESTAEDQKRSNPADLKGERSETDG